MSKVEKGVNDKTLWVLAHAAGRITEETICKRIRRLFKGLEFSNVTVNRILNRCIKPTCNILKRTVGKDKKTVYYKWRDPNMTLKRAQELLESYRRVKESKAPVQLGFDFDKPKNKPTPVKKVQKTTVAIAKGETVTPTTKQFDVSASIVDMLVDELADKVLKRIKEKIHATSKA